MQAFLNSKYKIHSIYHLPKSATFFSDLPANINLFEINNVELNKISTLQTPNDSLALVHIAEVLAVDQALFKNQFSLVLDDVQDPGNLGTIIRTADWFGIKNIVCSLNTVEAYNPKTVQASMGSLASTNIFYTELLDFVEETKLPVFGAMLSGQSIYETNFGSEGIIVLGNEGNGISVDLQKHINKSITIPKLGEAESLNVAISAAIFCSEIARNR